MFDLEQARQERITLAFLKREGYVVSAEIQRLSHRLTISLSVTKRSLRWLP